MKEYIVYSSEYICIVKKDDGFYIQSFKKGMSLEQFSKIVSSNPEIKISSIITIRNVLVNSPVLQLQKFADLAERVKIELSEDELKAYITLCVSEEDLKNEHQADLFKEIMLKLKLEGVIYGVKKEVLFGKLRNNIKILVAEGVPPVNGEDSEIKMFQLKETKPKAQEDGNVNHYELDLINKVSEGDWLGEKTMPTEGFPGKTVKGSILKALPGKSIPLMYDKNTVREASNNGRSVLYSRINGAVHYNGDKISVSNHLEIDGNVDFKTGNINFDGYLTVKGTIEDGFTISAAKDIEILSEYGIGSVKEVRSNEGSVFIRGGIAGNSKAVIYSKKNVYTKFISDAKIECEGSVHIGFYCLNSTIKAKEVILDSPRGQIIGGNIDAEIRVVASIIGSPTEKRTYINVSGFDRATLKQSFDKICADMEMIKNELAKAKMEISIYGNTLQLTAEQAKVYEGIRENYYQTKDRLKKYEEDYKVIKSYLKTHGEGEVAVLKKVFPNTQLIIKKVIKEITAPVINTTFYVQDREMKEL